MVRREKTRYYTLKANVPFSFGAANHYVNGDENKRAQSEDEVKPCAVGRTCNEVNPFQPLAGLALFEELGVSMPMPASAGAMFKSSLMVLRLMASS